ncbi:MAG: hypothetical protein QOJ73_1172 [Streptosporangiaceae bacterium]|jgi:hypothetical protein|nr:hypothetical protein [Streptosporangiaceae bacterium]
MAVRSWRGAVIEKTEEDLQPALLDGRPGIWIKADVDWLVLWFNWKFEAWTPLRPDFCVQCHTPGGKRQIWQSSVMSRIQSPT